MALGKRLIIDARTGKQNYIETEIDLPQTATPLGGRDTTKELDDLIALLKSKGVI